MVEMFKMYNCVARTKQYPKRSVFVKTVDGFRPLTILTKQLPLRRLIGVATPLE